MKSARWWEALSWALLVLAAFPVLFAGHALAEHDLGGAAASLVPAVGCGLFGYFARMRHDKVVFGTPTPRWLSIACAAMGALVLVLSLLRTMEQAEAELHREAQADVRPPLGM